MAHNATDFGDDARIFDSALGFQLDSQSSGAAMVKPANPLPTPTGLALLHGESPKALLDGIADGDPLDIRARCAARVAFQGLLMDLDRVMHRSMAYVAYFAARDRYRGKPSLDEFIDLGIDESIQSLIEEDWSADRLKSPIDPENDPYASVSMGAGIDPGHARRVTLEFNLQPIAIRRPLYCVLVKNHTFAKAATHFEIDPDELRGHVRKMLSRMAATDQTEAQLDALIDALEEGV